MIRATISRWQPLTLWLDDIDEVENHLHPRWMQRLVAAMKTMVRQPNRFVTVIFTTHNMELMETFKHDVAEDGLAKGGYLIDQDMQ